MLHHFDLMLPTQVESDLLGFAVAGIILQLDVGVKDPKQKH